MTTDPRKLSAEDIRETITFPRHDLQILRTVHGDFVVDADRQPVDAATNWSDFFYEPYTQRLYRQDERGRWFDLEGFPLPAPVFLRGDVLVSLPGKTSRRSWAFRESKVLMSPNARLIQVGKMVYDADLEPVRYFGEKVTGLGRDYVTFGGEDCWQEVRRGFRDRGFLNEFTHQPLVIHDEEIVAHDGTIRQGERLFAFFRGARRAYVTENDSATVLEHAGEPLGLDLSTYRSLNAHEVVAADTGKEQFYYDLAARRPFSLPETGGDKIVHVGKHPLRLRDRELYNLRTERQEFVYDTSTAAAFTLDEGAVRPAAVRAVPGFPGHYLLARVAGQERLVVRRDARTVRLGEEGMEVAEILGTPDRKLLNARDTQGRELVLDVRGGLSEPTLATIDGYRLLRTVGEVHRVGDRALQHVLLDTLGGSVERIIDLEEPTLRPFALPATLTEYPDQPEPSGFAGNPILRIDFADPEVVRGEPFYRAAFLTYLGEERAVLLQAANCRPLHLEGGAHRNELVVAFQPHTVAQPYRLGGHEMVGANTLTEDLREEEILLSVHQGQSWLPFYDTFLPVFRRAIELPGDDYWDCRLFELRDAGKGGEYVAVEAKPPYRVLASKSRRRVRPKLITSKTRVLSDPDELTALRKFFMADPGMLVEVE